MDAVNIILTALMSGATAGAQGIAGDAIRDAYQALKSLIQNRAAGRQSAETILTKYEENTDTWEKPMKDLLVEIRADQDRLILEAAELFLAELKAQEPRGPKFNLQVKGDVQGMVQGDHANVTMNFGKPGKEDITKPARRKK